jgi:SAM-dependent methyltransferase
MKIFLPGGKEQLKFLFDNYKNSPKSILVIGSASESIANSLSVKYKTGVELIVTDYESLINSKLMVSHRTKLSLMNLDTTDFKSDSFDLVYAQASISLTNRNKIIKELSRILKSGGFLCVGEIIALQKTFPPFVKNIFETSDLLPIWLNEIDKYYIDKRFSIQAKINLSHRLKEYYTKSSESLRGSIKELKENEKSYFRKLINKISHESNAYLKLGGDKYWGFYSLLLKKERV